MYSLVTIDEEFLISLKNLTSRAFQFPIDMHLEPEYWAETGELDEVERHELNVLENELFTVQPKTGRLSPGGRTTVTASYK